MISKALQFISDILNQFLKNRFGTDENKVILNVLLDSSGTVPLSNQNKLVISLINIEKETNRQYYVHHKRLQSGDYASVSPEEKYNLDILVSSNFDDYNETLKFLNAVIGFFQVNNILDNKSFPGMPDDLGRLEFDIEKVSYQQMHSLWTAMGAKYLPSVIYKMRLLTIQGDEAYAYTPKVTAISNTAEP